MSTQESHRAAIERSAKAFWEALGAVAQEPAEGRAVQPWEAVLTETTRRTMPPEVLFAEDLAVVLRIETSTAEELLRGGELPTADVFGRLCTRRGALFDWLSIEWVRCAACARPVAGVSIERSRELQGMPMCDKCDLVMQRLTTN